MTILLARNVRMMGMIAGYAVQKAISAQAALLM
jgi:uncharacterized membrane protein (Fun14 family)